METLELFIQELASKCTPFIAGLMALQLILGAVLAVSLLIVVFKMIKLILKYDIIPKMVITVLLIPVIPILPLLVFISVLIARPRKSAIINELSEAEEYLKKYDSSTSNSMFKEVLATYCNLMVVIPLKVYVNSVYSKE